MAQIYNFAKWKDRVRTSDAERKLLDVRKFIYDNHAQGFSPKLFRIYCKVGRSLNLRILTVIMENSTEIEWLKTPEYYLVMGGILRKKLRENR